MCDYVANGVLDQLPFNRQYFEDDVIRNYFVNITIELALIFGRYSIRNSLRIT